MCGPGLSALMTSGFSPHFRDNFKHHLLHFLQANILAYREPVTFHKANALKIVTASIHP